MNKSFLALKHSKVYSLFPKTPFFQLVVVMNMEPLMTSVPTKENVLAKITMLETSVTDALKDSLAFPTAKDALAMTKDQKAQSVTPLENVLAKLTSKATVVINA